MEKLCACNNEAYNGFSSIEEVITEFLLRRYALSSIVAKAVNKMILNRIQPKLDQHLRPNQNGFRRLEDQLQHIF